jgi:UDP-N-acetylglucosamine 2-epimerase (non-hydrolysing)
VPQGYAVATLHRPSNVDDDERLTGLMDALRQTSRRLPVLFPVHPRTRDRIERLKLDRMNGDLMLCEPLPYVDFLSLLSAARVVLTDSGGIQEETTILAVPCLTLRDNTERPVTVALGTNRLIGSDPTAIMRAVGEVLSVPMPVPSPPPLWDGSAAQRIVAILERVSLSATTADATVRAAS